MNFLKETIKDLDAEKLTPSDVLWVGSNDGQFAMSWDEFAQIANVDYHDGYGAQEVCNDLVVVGLDWWLERGEYDGSEWWDFKRTPVKAEALPFQRVVGGMWDTIDRLHQKDDDE